MLANQISTVDENLLNEVCRGHWAESQTLDFKQTLPRTDDRSRQEFCKDVCAFANATGGDLVYGLAEANGRADAPAPMSEADFPADATKRRLGQILESGVEPRLDGVAMREVRLATGGYVLVVRVSESFRKPHRYSVDGDARWPIRADSRTAELTYSQIREAFSGTASLLNHARNFRSERLAAILTSNGVKPMIQGPRCAVHVIPLAAVAGSLAVDVGALYDNFHDLSLHGWGGASRSLNLDGLCIYPPGKNALDAYVQVFRTGAIEVVQYAGAYERPQVIPSLTASKFVLEAIDKSVTLLNRLSIDGPAIATVSLLDVAGVRFGYQSRDGWEAHLNLADRQHMVLPEAWADRVGDLASLQPLARWLLDTLWQSFDFQRCMFYDDQGRWNER